MKKLLLTGATGLIGTAIVGEAIQREYKVTCLVNPNSTREANIPKHKNITITHCNIDEYNAFEVKEKYDVFMHLAWEKTVGSGRDDVDTQLKNIQHTLDAIKLAKRAGCKTFVGAGSQAEYGVQKVNLTPELAVQPTSGYGIAKYAAGCLGKLLCEQLGVHFNWIRILSTYGKNDGEHTLISHCINELKNGRSPQLTKCEQIWDYLNAKDAACAFFAVAERGIDGKIYPLGAGVGRSLRDYAIEIAQIINPEIQLDFGVKEYYPHQPMYLVADISELTQDTGWKPSISFSEGIKEMLV
ncbi:MAG: NAD(P)-dependent oxidoreductase [Ruminococcaceae bacterium]|nr:NAD(P)-dependent oxidoreductase [Oscillospiraceae bacterium]